MEQYIEFASNHYILTSAWLGLLAMLVYGFIGTRLRGYKSANPAFATELINRQDAVVVDVRDDNEFANGHIINAIHIPLGYLGERIKELDTHKNKPIIVGCRTGQRSGQACAMLKKSGFEQVYNLNGGVSAWQSDNLPITKK